MRPDYKDFYIFLGIIIIVCAGIIIWDADRTEKVKKNFSNPLFAIAFAGIIVISLIGLASKNKRIQFATRQGLISFMIVYFAHLDLLFASFFLIASMAYFIGPN